ncbi:tyrosine-protein kinase receptor isoform X1 [Paramormyrops kingsleyae]|uniref:Tyrosine-protein kinase receptor n=1 Tax=Paramormyrops kingsleyae TaxID=1676925 RepID=A0A3B3QM26_9TELE|nr:leukocyte tyrosine kinase receptor isoform X1 [Paramormyrops kingsleyae]
MGYCGRHPFINLLLCIPIATSSSFALLDILLNETVQGQLLPQQWNPREVSYTASCDLESPCSWTLSNYSSGGDWRITKAQRRTSDTQRAEPPADHSVGDANGHLLLLTATAAESAGHCQFFIASPVLHSSGPHCQLQLARYQTVGILGNLTVQVKPMDSDVAKSSTFLGHQGQHSTREQWEVLKAHIGLQEKPFQVILLYSTCGVENWSSLAIDSLELKDCDAGNLMVDCMEDMSFHCKFGDCIDKSKVCDFHNDCPLAEDEGPVCDTLPLGSHCSFEAGFCGWTMSSGPTSWTLSSGEKLAAEDLLGTALQKTKDHFLFLRVRSNFAGGKAVVHGPLLPSMISSAECLMHLSLYIYGDVICTVLLSVEGNGTAVVPLWERSGHWMDSWMSIMLKLPNVQNRFQLHVETHWGPGSVADIALDNITLGISCFESGFDPVFLSHSVLHKMDGFGDLDILSPYKDPDASEVTLTTWWFTSCGASGPRGPTQAQCDSAYRNTNVSVIVGTEGPLKGVQMWRVPSTNRYLISAYGAAGGKGARNHNSRSHGVFISAAFTLNMGDILYVLVGQQGEDACPGRKHLSQKICLGESTMIEDGVRDGKIAGEWAGGGGGGGGATFIYWAENGVIVPLLIAAGGGGNAYLEDPESSLDHINLEQYDNHTVASGTNGKTGAAGGGGGWMGASNFARAGKSLLEGAEGGTSCPSALSSLAWATSGGFGGGGGACSAGGGGGGYRGGDTSLTDNITADGQEGVSYIHPSGEIFLLPLAAMESHGEVEIKVQLNCTHCQSQSCHRNEDTKVTICLCPHGEVLANDNVTCVVPPGLALEGHPSLPLVLAAVVSTAVTVIILTCASLTLIYYRKKNRLQGMRVRLQSPEYKLSKIRTSTIMTDYNPNYCFAGKVASLGELKEVPRKNITLLRALGHGAFGEVYEGQLLGLGGDNIAMQVAIKTLPEVCSEQDEMDFLMEALIMSKFSHQNIVSCIGVSLQTLPRFILLELMTGGDMKSFLRQNRPKTGKVSSLSMLELLHMARDIAFGCHYLEENHFIHRDIAARNCLLTCSGPRRVAKIGDFGMARDIYRASYYRKGGHAMLPVKWMPPEAFLEGIFTCKTDTWSFGVLLWEIFSLGYMPYPCKTNQEVLEFVTSGGRMDPPKNCPGPVYRIMTQCWQHCPEHRPNFSTILERVNYCTQDPDVINASLPVEYGPLAEKEVNTVPQTEGSAALTPLLTPEPSLPWTIPPLPQDRRPVSLQQALPWQPEAHSQAGASEVTWVEPVLSLGAGSGAWLHPDQHLPVTASSSGGQKFKNKTKNLWNPTYGSWGLDGFGRGKTALSQTQSMPLSGTPSSPSATPAPERDDSGFDGNGSSSPTSSQASPSSSSPSSLPPSSLNAATSSAATTSPIKNNSTVGTELAKLQSFPCGTVNYAYEDQNYEANNLPLVVTRVPVASSNPGPSISWSGISASRISKPHVKRHASYGHEDIKRYTKSEKPTRDRDSGLSLSEDLTVIPV